MQCRHLCCLSQQFGILYTALCPSRLYLERSYAEAGVPRRVQLADLVDGPDGDTGGDHGGRRLYGLTTAQRVHCMGVVSGGLHDVHVTNVLLVMCYFVLNPETVQHTSSYFCSWVEGVDKELCLRQPQPPAQLPLLPGPGLRQRLRQLRVEEFLVRICAPAVVSLISLRK